MKFLLDLFFSIDQVIYLWSWTIFFAYRLGQRYDLVQMHPLSQN